MLTRTVPAIGGALAVLATAVVLFVSLADRGRGPEAVVVTLPEVVMEATTPNDTPEPSQEHASAPQQGAVNDAGDGRPDDGEMERSHAPVEEPWDELDALTTAAGQIDVAESIPPDRTSGSADAEAENSGGASSRGATMARADPGPENEPDRSSSTVEQPVEEVPPTPRTVPRHGQFAWFEIGVITRSSNLREQPDVESPIVARLAPGTRVQVLEARPVFGYYRVLSDGKNGWVWWLNVDPDNPADGRG